MWIAIYEALEWFGIVSCPQISPELYLREIKKKKRLYLAGCLDTSGETFLPSENG